LPLPLKTLQLISVSTFKKGIKQMNKLEKFPQLAQVIDVISSISPFQKKSIIRQCENGDDRYLNFAESVVERMVKVVEREDALEYIAKTYLWYTKTIRVEEMFFSKEKKYRYDDYETVYEKVYGRDDYMIDYVVGLGMTQIFWPNHWDIFKFFLDNFIPRVKEFNIGAEIGVGHGLFHSEFLKGCPNMSSTLLDISPSSLMMTKKMIAATGVDLTRVSDVLCDVQKEIPLENKSLDALLLGELIEHIQDGESVMTKLSTKMSKSGICYFSSAANSPAEDHILLFRTINEIRDFIRTCGWKIQDEHLGTLNNMSIEEAEEAGHNINYAAVLSVA
jgi:hypothetical protein